MRLLFGLVLVAVALLCSAGYLAAGEPGNHWIWRVGYAGIGVVCLGAGARILAGESAKGDDG